MKTVLIYITEKDSNIELFLHKQRLNDNLDLKGQIKEIKSQIKSDLVNKRFKTVFVPIENLNQIILTHEIIES